jgi:hypothetical protein
LSGADPSKKYIASETVVTRAAGGLPRSNSDLPRVFRRNFRYQLCVTDEETRMPKFALLSYCLREGLEKRGMTDDELSVQLGFRHPFTVRAWLRGDQLPSIAQISSLSRALELNVAEMTIGWVIETRPELEYSMRNRVLDRLGWEFPMSDRIADAKGDEEWVKQELLEAKTFFTIPTLFDDPV